MTKSLRRRVGNKVTRKVFVIVCEGDKTEPIYFNKYKTRYSNLKIEIPSSKYTDPINLVKFSLVQKEKYSLDLKNGDAIWCVFDCNSNSEEDISTACKKAKNHIKLCLSNPSFELWYLLHFVYVCSKLSNDQLIEKLKIHIPDYEKNADYFDLLKSKRESAISSAKRLNELHKRNGTNLISINSNPSTQVFEIVEDLLKITEHSD